MVRGKIKIKSPAGDNMAIRELMEMALEVLGEPMVQNIEESANPDGSVQLTMEFTVDAPQGSRGRVEYCLTDFLKRFGPGNIISLKEENPQQIGFKT